MLVKSCDVYYICLTPLVKASILERQTPFVILLSDCLETKPKANRRVTTR